MPKLIGIIRFGEVLRESRPVCLVIDDEYAVGKIVAAWCPLLGYVVFSADNCAEAGRIWSEHGSEIDLLITDVCMPDCGGGEIASRLQEEKRGLRVIFMSGNIPESIDVGIELIEGQNFLQKPFTTAQFERVMSVRTEMSR